MRTLLILLACLLLAPVVLFLLATDSAPLLQRPEAPDLADLARGKAIVESLHLRHMKEGETRRFTFAESDLDRGVRYLADRVAHGGASAQIARGQLVVRASLPVPGLPRFLNLELALVPGGDMLQPAQMRIGALTVPAALTPGLLGAGLALSPVARELSAARSLLDQARLQDDGLALAFTWRGQAVARALTGAASLDPAVLDAYRAHLNGLSGSAFAPLLGEAFALAQQRSRDGDPVLENRAALTVLGELVVGGRFFDATGTVALKRRPGVRLGGRGDFAQHFALSAFIAAAGGERLSDLAGLYKEIQDSRGGSGFSFNDLAADRAGARLGEAATRDAASARRLQARLAGAARETAFFPAVQDLPEFMPEAEFKRRFGGVGAPAYRAVTDTIEARIAALPLYRE